MSKPYVFFDVQGRFNPPSDSERRPAEGDIKATVDWTEQTVTIWQFYCGSWERLYSIAEVTDFGRTD